MIIIFATYFLSLFRVISVLESKLNFYFFKREKVEVSE